MLMYLALASSASRRMWFSNILAQTWNKIKASNRKQMRPKTAKRVKGRKG
jgi:hypothetical protein